MSVTLPRQRIRVSVDPLSHAGLECRLQGGVPKLWRGTEAYVEIGMYTGGVFVDAITGITSVTLDILTDTDRDGSPLVEKTVLAAAMQTIAVGDWTGNTDSKYHARFALTKTDTQFDMTAASENVLNLWMVVHALMASGDYITLGAGQLQVEEDGAQNGLSVVTAPSPSARLKDGDLQIKNPDTGLWNTVLCRGAAGQEFYAPGPGVAE
jgi:hypothetical protein